MIRPAEPADAEAIARVHVQSWQEAYRDDFPSELLGALTWEDRLPQWAATLAADTSSPRCLLVAEDERSVVGFASCGPAAGDEASRSVGEVYAIYLTPSVWSRGLGRSLIEAATAHLAGEGYADAHLWVLDTNARARRFYEAAGWRADGATKVGHVFGGRHACNEVRYVRSLL